MKDFFTILFVISVNIFTWESLKFCVRWYLKSKKLEIAFPHTGIVEIWQLTKQPIIHQGQVATAYINYLLFRADILQFRIQYNRPRQKTDIDTLETELNNILKENHITK